MEAEITSCSRCHAVTKGTFPADLSGPLQYGTGIKAFVLHLLTAQRVALKRVQQTVAPSSRRSSAKRPAQVGAAAA